MHLGLFSGSVFSRIPVAFEKILEITQAGEKDALDCTEQNWGLLLDCATRSYPVGHDDGCWCVWGLENDVACRLGSGSISGWGALASVGREDVEVFAVIAAAQFSNGRLEFPWSSLFRSCSMIECSIWRSW